MRAVTTLAIWLIAAGAAHAACYENLGRTGCPDAEVFPRSDLRALSCENLWLVRNSIYHEHGYCFRTARARAQFDISSCYVTDAAELQFNRFERANVARIRDIEQQKGCTP